LGPELERSILEALQEAGGSAQRTNLRNVLRPVVRTVDFDQAIEGLVSRGRIRVDRPTLYWRSPRGNDVPYRATVYSLASGRDRHE
jgi:hypothetical protein